MDQIVSVLLGLVSKFPIAMTIISVVGILRIINKPFFTFARAVVQATPSTADDQFIDNVEASKGYKALCWFLDFVASIKVGPQKAN